MSRAAKLTDQYQSAEKVYTDNFLFFLNLIRNIRKAQTTISISLYIFQLDRIGKFILSELKSASLRGVEINLILDGVGSHNSIFEIRKSTENLNAFNFVAYHPIPWPFSKNSLDSYRANRKLLSLYANLNRRNHTKLFLFDKNKVFLGSHNIFDPARFWRETSVETTDQEVCQSVDLILSWLLESSIFLKRVMKKSLKKQITISNKIFISNTHLSRKVFRKKLLVKIKSAKTSIQISVPYFYPNLAVIRQLISASHRGVDVEIIIPAQSDVFLFPRLSRLFYKSLLNGHIKVYEYSPGMIHAKHFRIDDWVVVGSSNLNRRSLFRDIELDYCLQTESCKKALDEQFCTDRSHSVQVIKPATRGIFWILDNLLALIFGFFI